MEIVLELRRFFYVSVYMGYIYCMGSGGQHCFASIILIKYGFISVADIYLYVSV